MLRVVQASHRTDTGRQREANEDSYFARAPVFAVADGMGGAQAGEVASRIAVEAFEPELADGAAPEGYLRETAQRANREIFELAQGDTSRSGMGTTLTAAVVAGDEVSFGHVGDSRAYLFRNGELSQLTNDHSLVEELRRQGKLTRDQAAEHPQRSVITRALGPEPDVAVDTMTVRGRSGDVFVLCSDGLTTMLSDDEVTATLAAHSDLDEAARRLVRAANDRGGRDNITVVLFRLEDPERGEDHSGEEDATLVGISAAEAGLTPESIREAQLAERRVGTRETPVGVPTGAVSPRPRWRGRALKATIGLLVVAALLAAAVYGARQVWFLGADEAGRVTLYRGLPYELPLGLDLYSESFSSPVRVESLPEDRREAATDHELRSRDDAVDLLFDLQRAAEEQAAAERPAGGPGAGPGAGGGAGSGQSGGGGQGADSGARGGGDGPGAGSGPGGG